METSGTSIAIQGGENCDTRFSAMLKFIAAKDYTVSMLGFSFAWLGYFLSHLEFLKLVFQVTAVFFGAATGAVTFGWTIWRWRRDIAKQKAKLEKG